MAEEKKKKKVNSRSAWPGRMKMGRKFGQACGSAVFDAGRFGGLRNGLLRRGNIVGDEVFTNPQLQPAQNDSALAIGRFLRFRSGK